MNLLHTIANNIFLWKLYFIIGVVISIIIGVSKYIELFIREKLEINNEQILNETDKEKKMKYIKRSRIAHTLHFSIYHALSIAFGFLLIFFEIQLLKGGIHLTQVTSICCGIS